MPYTSFHQTHKEMGFYEISLVIFLIVFFCPPLAAQPGCERESLSTGLIQTVEIPQLPFIPNKGQISNNVAFYAKSSYGTTLITKYGEIVYAIERRQGDVNDVAVQSPSKVDVASDIAHQSGVAKSQNFRPSLARRTDTGALKEGFIGGRIRGAKGERETATRVHYFTGNDPSGWKTNISTFEELDMGEIYEGISLRLKAHGNTVEKYFSVKPGADPETIRVKLGGAKALTIDKYCRIEVEADAGAVIFSRPFAYQEIDGKKVDVAVDYRIIGGQETPYKKEGVTLPAIPCLFSLLPLHYSGQTGQDCLPVPIGYGLNVPSYNKTKELVIGPLVASTYIGGKSADVILSLATDASGNVYAAGHTRSLDFPTTTEAYDASYNGGSDAFIVKLNATMTNIISCTYLGGSAEESLRSMAVDTEGNVYVAGYTWSMDFPTSVGALCRTFRGGNIDAFISRFDATLSTLIASTYLGGGSEDHGYSLALDPNGSVYLAGRTLSANFPTTEGAYDVSRRGYGDVFTSKINGYLSNIIASTLLGGTSDDIARCVTVDAQGNVYVSGETASPDFPVTGGSYNTSHNGEVDGFVSKLKGDLTGLLASTFLGGSSEDGISAILKHTDGGVYVSGRTASADFPTTILAYDTIHGGGGYDAFVSRLSSDLAYLPASTFLGGVSHDRCRAITADARGDICVAGETASSNFPTTPDAYDISYNGGDCDAFLSKFNSMLTGLLSSTFLGGSGYDYASCITTDKDGYLCVSGYTKPPDFPVTANASNTVYKSDEAFVSKVLSKAASTPHGEKGGHNR